MLRNRKQLAVIAAILTAVPPQCFGWGQRAHAAIDQAAVESLPADGPVFLKKYVDWIEASATVPDTWRGTNTPFLRIEEDPNHGWFREQFSFMPTIPRSRYEFVLALHDQYLRIRVTDPQDAARMNVRWTGTLPYAAMEGYGRLVSAMRLMRKAQQEQTPQSQQTIRFLEQDCAFYTFWLGHYIGDGAQPLHDTIHHDGWQGPDPKGYTRDPKIHGRFESAYVEKIGLTAADIEPRMAPPSFKGDIFDNTLELLNRSSSHVEQIYILDKQQAFEDPNNAEAKNLVYEQTASAADMLRDLLCRAWLESGMPLEPGPNPIDEKNPAYNPSTGSAPAPLSEPIQR
jgi:hypothetical protein